MAKRLFKLRSLLALRQSSFTTPSAPGASNRLAAEEINWSPTQDFIDRPLQFDMLGSAPGIVGGKGGKLTFKVGLRGVSTLGDNVSTANLGGALEEVLVACCLRQISQQGQHTAASQEAVLDRTVNLKLFAGTGVTGKFSKGNTGGAPIAAVKGGGTALQVRLIPNSAETGDELTLAPPLANGAQLVSDETCYGGEVFYPDPDASSETYCTLVAQGDKYKYTFTGCRGVIKKVSGDASKRIVMEFELEVTTWTCTDGSNTGGEQLANLALADIKALASPFYWTATGAAIPIAGFEFDPGMSVAPVASTEATDGKAGFLCTQVKPMLKVKPYFAPDVWQGDYAAGNVRQAIVQLGNQPGHTFTILIPYGQIVKFPAEVDAGGIVAHDVEILGTINTGLGEVPAGTLAPFYITFH